VFVCTETTTCCTDRRISFPYGRSRFQEIREGGFFYVDKTRFIKVLEDKDADHALFLRPPRFGKTLFLNMLECYYDKNTTEQQYERWFKGLDIYEHGRRAGSQSRSCHVLHFDFSIDTTYVERIQELFYSNINITIQEFAIKYGLHVAMTADALGSLRLAAAAVQRVGGCLYVFVDEYDRFANKLMIENREAYVDVVTGVSKVPAFADSSILRDPEGAVVMARLADASGYNVATSLTHQREFASLAGFTEGDVVRALRLIPSLTDDDRKRALEIMREYYNGYLFVGSQTSLYNSTLAIYFLRELAQRGRDVLSTASMATMMDDNVRVSHGLLSLMRDSAGGLRAVSRVAQCDTEWRDQGCPPARQSIEVSRIEATFTLAQLLQPSASESENYEQALLLMFYHGVLTLFGRRHLVIPNLVASKQLVRQLVAGVLRPQRPLAALITAPTLEAVVDLLKDIIENSNSAATLCDNNLKEAGVHALVCAVLTALRRERNEAVRAASEQRVDMFDLREQPTGRDGYFDLLLTAIDRDGRRCGVLFEFKRIVPAQLTFQSVNINSRKNHESRFVADAIRRELDGAQQSILNYVASGTTIRDLISSARTQLRGYLTGTVEKFRLNRLHAYVVLSAATRIVVESVEWPADIVVKP
jgi:hypothetical protein